MVEFNAELIKKYDVACPRYTSYPTALQFNSEFTESDYIEVARDSNNSNNPISIYIHLPFCNTLCYFCACNKIITKRKEKSEIYLDILQKEIELKAKLFDKTRNVTQLHFGGGTPTFFTNEQLKRIIKLLKNNFNFVDDDLGEFSIEIDPRSIAPDDMQGLREIGLNRVSLGVQDFDLKVQRAVNRIQPLELTEAIINAARNNNFKSINMDLIYGLPFQTLKTFSDTLSKVIEISPDRISLFNYAHLPGKFIPQRRIKNDDLPTPLEKLDILKLSIEKLTNSGYVFIGMDHFAKKNDELTIAQQEGNLYRNFQGYSTHSNCDLIGFGVSAISSINNSYSQNAYNIDEYSELLQNDKIPVIKGIKVELDDQIRRIIITELMCNFYLDFKKIESLYNINFLDYFSQELNKLIGMKKDELLDFNDSYIKINEKGRLLIRNICSCFDKYYDYVCGIEERHSKSI